MCFMNIFKINKYRHFLSIIVALLFSLVINHYYAFSDCYLIPLTTIYVMQTPIGNSFYQGMRRLAFLLILVALFSLVIFSMPFFYLVMHDVVIGAAIGIFVNLLVLPRRADTEFRLAVLPLMRSYNEYFMNVVDMLLQKEAVLPGNSQLEIQLQELPSWVYTTGFDSGLQMGYRFFLVKLTQISDVLFAMHHLARHEYDKELMAKMRLPLLQCAEHISKFFSAMILVLELKELTEDVSDLEKEVNELEKQFKLIVPLSLEMLDMKRDYVYLAAFVYYFKDLRKLLVKLGEALR
jgi:hypothetical protein